MREMLKYIFTKYSIVLYFASVSLLLLSFFPTLGNFNNKITDILYIFGTGIAITTFVSSILNFYFQKEIHIAFSIVSGAEKAGIRKIYPDRSYAISEINSELEKARGEIKMLSIAGTDFFHGGGVLHELGRMCRNNSSTSVQILLLDPRSKHAVDRVIREECIDIQKTSLEDRSYITLSLCKDILLSLDQLERICENKLTKNKANFNLQIRTYDTAAILLYVMVNGRTFVEQYHYGITDEEEQTDLTRCIGKKVPVFEFSPGYVASELWLSHFKYIWETAKSREVSPGFHRWLSDILQRDEISYKVYRESNEITDKYIMGKSGIQALATPLLPSARV